MTICTSCGRDNPADARFCNSCAAPLAAAAEPAREERKVVTVFFADLVGFTQRAETMDPEDVRGLLAPYWEYVRSELERRGGTVEKFIGDAVMALFGAPVSHEDDPERAVRAALAIRDWAREEEAVQVRIAVGTGEALVRLGARPAEGEGMASGDVVNTAARLQSAAPVNGVIVGETTYRATRHAIEYVEHEPVDAKGKAEPIPVWEAVQARSRHGVDVVQESRAPLVGRQRELDALRDALGRARQQPSVQLVTLVGVPGIGKSRLVYELMQTVAAGPELVIWRQGRSLPYGEGVSFWALGEMVKAQAGVLETDSVDETAAKLVSSVREVVAASDAPWVERHLRSLVGAGEQETGDPQEAFAAWRHYLEALAEQRPAVLVFEDLHWADEGLLDFLDHLVDWATDVPLLVVGTARPELLERRPGWGGGKRNATTLSLAPLGAEETARLIHGLAGRAVLPAETQAELLERAEGNPLYAEQYVRMLSERLGDESLALPETVQGIIAARLDALPQAEKELLQNASVLGKVFWTGALEAVGGVDRRSAEALLHALDRKEFVRRERRPSLAGEGEYVFRHVLVRDVAYSQIPRAARVDKHRRAAEWIESLGRPDDHAEMLAHHYTAALELARAAGVDTGPLVEPARRALRIAGERALALAATVAAARFFGDALELDPPGEERLDLLFGRAKALYGAGGDAAVSRLEETSAELLDAGDPARAAELHALLVEACWYRGDTDRAEAHFRRGLELAGQGDSPARARVTVHGARLRTLSGSYAEAIPLAREALMLAQALRLEDVEIMALNYLGVARTYKGDRRGLDDLEESLALALRSGALEFASRATNNLAACAHFHGDLARGLAMNRESLRLAELGGNAESLRFLRGTNISNLHATGQWDVALREADEFIAACEAGAANVAEANARCVRAAIRLARGDDAGAVEDAKRHLELSRGIREPHWALSQCAEVAAKVGDGAGARRYVDELLTLDLDNLPAGLVWDAATVADRIGRRRELADALGRVSVESNWIRASQLVVDGSFVEAAELLTGMGYLPEEAGARLLAAEALVAQGRRAEADEQLRRALAFYRSVGATRFVREGEALLAATA